VPQAQQTKQCQGVPQNIDSQPVIKGRTRRSRSARMQPYSFKMILENVGRLRAARIGVVPGLEAPAFDGPASHLP
jgi:hypothetical protein